MQSDNGRSYYFGNNYVAEQTSPFILEGWKMDGNRWWTLKKCKGSNNYFIWKDCVINKYFST